MRLLIVAVGVRQPQWVCEGFREYARRMPRELPCELVEIKPEPRTAGKPVGQILAAEARRIAAALPASCRRVALDERGALLATRQLAERLSRWRDEGEDIAFLIGGPDGLADDLKATAQERLALSALTLPHGLVRILLAEALYRAYTLLAGHPYHRA